MYNTRRLNYPAPDLTGPYKPNRLPTRICLISAASLCLSLLLFIMYTGNLVLYVHFWAYIAVAALIVLLLLAAGAFAIRNRIKSDRARSNTTIVLFGFLIMLALIAVSVCWSLGEMYMKPVGYSDSPEGDNSIVIMKTAGEGGSYISAYPAIGKHFYVAAIESDFILSNGVIQGVDWEGDRKATVRLLDAEGNETSLVVDFSPLYSEDSESPETAD